MQTASFSAVNWDDPHCVSIALYPPRGWGNRRQYRALCPPPMLLQMWKKGRVRPEKYRAWYHRERLAKLVARRVFEELGEDAILLCHEPAGEFCHRRLVAEWLEEHLGIEVEEV